MFMRRIVMQFLGELDAADGLEGILRGEQEDAPLSRPVIDEGEPRQIVIDRADQPIDEPARRRPVVVAVSAIVAANGEARERDMILGRLEEQLLDGEIEHALMQLEQVGAVIAFELVAARVLLDLGGGALDFGQHVLAPDLDGAGEADFARRHGARRDVLRLLRGLVGELGDTLGDAKRARGDNLRALLRWRSRGLWLRLVGAMGQNRHAHCPRFCTRIGQVDGKAQALFRER